MNSCILKHRGTSLLQRPLRHFDDFSPSNKKSLGHSKLTVLPCVKSWFSVVPLSGWPGSGQGAVEAKRKQRKRP